LLPCTSDDYNDDYFNHVQYSIVQEKIEVGKEFHLFVELRNSNQQAFQMTLCPNYNKVKDICRVHDTHGIIIEKSTSQGNEHESMEVALKTSEQLKNFNLIIIPVQDIPVKMLPLPYELRVFTNYPFKLTRLPRENDEYKITKLQGEWTPMNSGGQQDYKKNPKYLLNFNSVTEIILKIKVLNGQKINCNAAMYPYPFDAIHPHFEKMFTPNNPVVSTNFHIKNTQIGFSDRVTGQISEISKVGKGTYLLIASPQIFHSIGQFELSVYTQTHVTLTYKCD